MSPEHKYFIEYQKLLIENDKKRLNMSSEKESDDVVRIVEDVGVEPERKEIENSEKENVVPPLDLSDIRSEQNVSVDERLNLSCNDGSLDREKQSFIDRLVRSDNPLTFRSNETSRAMLRRGEYSPNNTQLRVTGAPYLGFGEYDQQKLIVQQKIKADYKEYTNKKNEQIRNTVKSFLSASRPVNAGNTKAVQTNIQNINVKLITSDSETNSKESSPASCNSNKENREINANVQRTDERLSGRNSASRAEMDKPRGILSNRRTQTPTDHLLGDYNHGYTSSCLDGFSYQDRIDEIERERLKREAYERELRNQIDEKRRLNELRQEQERLELERENRRLEQQLIKMQLRMHEEQLVEDQMRVIRDEQSRRNSEDYLRRQEMFRPSYRKRLDSESSALSLRNSTNVASKLSHYSPPVSRRRHYSYTLPSSSSSYPGTSPRYTGGASCSSAAAAASSRYDAFTAYKDLNRFEPQTNYNRFSRYDSLSRIDSMRQQDVLNRLETLSINDTLYRARRHSATQQDLSASRKSPKLQRRSSSSRLLDEPLPAPVLKAHSPVARELKNSVAVNSSRSDDRYRRYLDKWEMRGGYEDSQKRNILSHLGTIRTQLQKEQKRMDEMLHQCSSQSKAVNFH